MAWERVRWRRQSFKELVSAYLYFYFTLLCREVDKTKTKSIAIVYLVCTVR